MALAHIGDLATRIRDDLEDVRAAREAMVELGLNPDTLADLLVIDGQDIIHHPLTD